MSGLTLNINNTDGSERTQASGNKAGNAKHEKFNRRRRFLEKRGFLNEKQNKNFRKQSFRKNGLHQDQQRQGSKSHPEPSQGVSQGAHRSISSSSTSSSTLPKPCLSSNIWPQGQVHRAPSVSSSAASASSQGRIVTATSETITVTTQPIFRGVPYSGNPHKYLAIDCEMVGTGPKGKNSELARCSIVNYDGDIVYDKFIKPLNQVTDLRTRWSGIRWQDLRNATPFFEAKKEILKILSGKVVIGHAIHNDLKALKYAHPAGLTRDTSRIPLLNKKAGLPETDVASLKRLTKALFNRDIQVGRRGHSSVEDAKATMELYRTVAVEWENTLASK